MGTRGDLVEEGRALAASVADRGVVASATHLLGVMALSRGDSKQA